MFLRLFPGQRWGLAVREGAGVKVPHRVLVEAVLETQRPKAPLDHLRQNGQDAEAQLLQDHPHANHPRVRLLRCDGVEQLTCQALSQLFFFLNFFVW